MRAFHPSRLPYLVEFSDAPGDYIEFMPSRGDRTVSYSPAFPHLEAIVANPDCGVFLAYSVEQARKMHAALGAAIEFADGEGDWCNEGDG